MVSKKRSSGITLIGFMMLLCIVGFFGYLAMRLIPMYIEYMGVVKSMEQVRVEPGIASKSPEEVRRSLIYRFDTQYVDPDAVPPQSIQILRKGGAATLRIRYERRVSFVHNLDLIGSFDKSVDLVGERGE